MRRRLIKFCWRLRPLIFILGVAYIYNYHRISWDLDKIILHETETKLGIRTRAESLPKVAYEHSVPNSSSASLASVWKRLEPLESDLCALKFSRSGFGTSVLMCPPVPSSPMKCLYNAHSESTICEARDLRVDTNLISVSKGGEPVLSVLGRPEEQEMPVYQPGAFALPDCNKLEVAEKYLRYHFNPVYKALMSMPLSQLACSVTVDVPTLFVTRFEYANLYHTMTDWYNTWLSLSIAGLLEEMEGEELDGAPLSRPAPHRIVFLDGHARSNLDATWKTLFTPDVSYLSAIAPNTCFKRAIFVPAGYTSPIYDWPDDCQNQRAVRQFSNFVIGQHGLLHMRPPSQRLVFVFRDFYVAHPRTAPNGVSRQITNLAEVERVVNELGAVHANTSELTAQPVQGIKIHGHRHRPHGLALHTVNMSFAKQLRYIRSSRVLAGVHGAGLTHSLFMHPSSTLLELQPETHLGFSHFEKFARWRGQNYVRVLLAGQFDFLSLAEEPLRALLTRALDGTLSMSSGEFYSLPPQPPPPPPQTNAIPAPSSATLLPQTILPPTPEANATTLPDAPSSATPLPQTILPPAPEANATTLPAPSSATPLPHTILPPAPEADATQPAAPTSTPPLFRIGTPSPATVMDTTVSTILLTTPSTAPVHWPAMATTMTTAAPTSMALLHLPPPLTSVPHPGQPHTRDTAHPTHPPPIPSLAGTIGTSTTPKRP